METRFVFYEAFDASEDQLAVERVIPCAGGGTTSLGALASRRRIYMHCRSLEPAPNIVPTEAPSALRARRAASRCSSARSDLVRTR
jgi:hypothetical protein